MNLPSNSETNLNNGIDPSGKYVIFQLGSYPWQSEMEATSGSGILHEAQHEVFNSMDGVASYSIFPSRICPPKESRSK